MKTATALAALLAIALAAPAAAADYELPVILPITGPASFVGSGTRDVLQIMEERVNQTGGVDGKRLRFVFRDDQTKPQVAVQLTNEALAGKPSVILGSTITAMCNAQAPLVAEGPLLYCYSPGIHPAPGGFVYSATISTTDLAEALIRFFRLKGWTRIAVMTSTDSSGQDADRGIDAKLLLPENKGVTVVAREHFTPGDVSVAAQIANVAAAKPQAIIAWTTGSAIATIFKAMIQAGLDLPVGTTNGNQTIPQMLQYADFAPKELYIPGGPFPEHDGIFALDKRVEAAQQAFYQAMKARNLPIDNVAATSWDATSIVVDALRKLGTAATPAQLRAHIDGLSDYAGIWGVYNFKNDPQRGLDAANAIVTRWSPQEKRFVWASEPGGKPLAAR
ncbi:MAG: receptor ligand binding region family protein [Rhodospirillales bacterium]|jgi:branched-chain amino acid transport system substrate-binding protein|nr:receptor ligand binding region family protein [Rhodospirillales bacterium]